MAYYEYPFEVRLIWALQNKELPMQYSLLLNLMSSDERKALVSEMGLSFYQEGQLSSHELQELIQEELSGGNGEEDTMVKSVLVARGQVELLRPLFDYDRDYYWITARAAIFGQLSVLKFILEQTPPDQREDLLIMAFRNALSAGQLETMQWLVEAGAVVVETTGFYNPLNEIPAGRVDMMEFVASKYPNPALLDSHLMASVNRSVYRYQSVQPPLDTAKIAFVVSHLSDPGRYGRQLEGLLHEALHEKNWSVADLLLARRSPQEQSRLLTRLVEDELTASPSNLELAAYALQHGADPSAVLVFAASVGDLELLQQSLNKGAGHFDWALTEALEAGARQPAVVKELLARGARTYKYSFNSDFTLARDYEAEEPGYVSSDNEDYY